MLASRRSSPSFHLDPALLGLAREMELVSRDARQEAGLPLSAPESVANSTPGGAAGPPPSTPGLSPADAEMQSLNGGGPRGVVQDSSDSQPDFVAADARGPSSSSRSPTTSKSGLMAWRRHLSAQERGSSLGGATSSGREDCYPGGTTTEREDEVVYFKTTTPSEVGLWLALGLGIFGVGFCELILQWYRHSAVLGPASSQDSSAEDGRGPRPTKTGTSLLGWKTGRGSTATAAAVGVGPSAGGAAALSSEGGAPATIFGSDPMPHDAPFFEDEHRIAWPLMEDTVPPWAVGFFAYGIGTALILSGGRILSPRSYLRSMLDFVGVSGRTRTAGTSENLVQEPPGEQARKRWVFVLFRMRSSARRVPQRYAVMYYLLTITLVEWATFWLKTYVGRKRPDFYAECGYNEMITPTSFMSTHASSEHESTTMTIRRGGKTLQPGSLSHCQANLGGVEDAMRSHPSGHSSLSFAACGFLLLDVRSLLLQFFFLGLATFVCASRTVDYRHSYEDVLGGAGLGMVVAYSLHRTMLKHLGALPERGGPRTKGRGGGENAMSTVSSGVGGMNAARQGERGEGVDKNVGGGPTGAASVGEEVVVSAAVELALSPQRGGGREATGAGDR